MELKVENQIINYMKIENEDYISITDMLKSKDGNFFVTDWLRNRNTIEFLGKLLQSEDKANQLIGFNDKYLSEVQSTASSIPESERKSVYYG